MNPPAAFLTVALLATTPALLSAQELIRMQFGQTPGAELGSCVAAAGDLNGDQVPDYLVSDLLHDVTAYSGATGTALYTLSGIAPQNFQADLFSVIEDVSGDGVSELVFRGSQANTRLQLRSGADGHVIRTHGNGTVLYSAASCTVDDRNQDGRDDYVIGAWINGFCQLHLHSGMDGSILGVSLAWSAPDTLMQLLNAGDLNGDGFDEIVALAETEPVTVINLRTDTVVNQVWPRLPNNDRTTAALGDVDRDGQPELALASGGEVQLFSLTTGNLVQTLFQVFDRHNSLERHVVAVGDLDADGCEDFAAFSIRRGADGGLVFFSGGHGRELSCWNLWLWLGFRFDEYRAQPLATVGDVDGDGFTDVLIGAGDSGDNDEGFWQLVSSRVLATRQYLPVNCAEGPFLPELGMSRPVIGRPLVFAGQWAPPGAAGFVLMSGQIEWPVNLGVNGCDSWVAWPSHTLLFSTPPGPDWTLSLPLPYLPQLVGMRFVVQGVYGPTTGPLGLDLTNAIWAKIGN